MRVVSVSLCAVALKNPLSNGMKKSSDHCHDSKTSGSVDGHIPEGELLLQVGEQQAVCCCQTLFVFCRDFNHAWCCGSFYAVIMISCRGNSTSLWTWGKLRVNE